MKNEYYNFGELKVGGVEIPIPQCYGDCIELIRSDFFRIYGRKASLFTIWVKGLRNHCIQYLLWLRLSAYRKGVLFPFCKWRQEHYGKKYGIDIHPSTKIGWGFYIGHGIAIVVNKTAIIGNNVNISQCSTIGSNSGHAAWIGNNVYIGPNSCIVENIQIGSDTTIGAGSVVTKSINANSIAVGVPCKVLGENNHPEYIKNRWEIMVK